MLLDTSGLLCLCHRGESQHGHARTLFKAAAQELTHNYVLAEFVALARVRHLPAALSLEFVAALLEHPEIQVTFVDEALHRAGVNFLQSRPDKAYSLCDAVSFLLMREQGVTQALTTDRHFEQEGLERLLRP